MSQLRHAGSQMLDTSDVDPNDVKVARADRPLGKMEQRNGLCWWSAICLPQQHFCWDLQVLQKTRAAFIEADASHGGNLDEDEFVNAFAGVLTTDEGGAPGALRKWVDCGPIAGSCDC